MEKSENAFDVNGTYIQVCQFQESLKNALFSMIDRLLKAFMRNGIMAQMSRRTGRIEPDHLFRNTKDFIVIFVRVSKALPDAFHRKEQRSFQLMGKKREKIITSNS